MGPGLLPVLQDTGGLSGEASLEQQHELVTAVEEVAVPAGLEVSPLSLDLLLEDDDMGAEIGQLFGTALAIILLVLAVVFWVRPGPGQVAHVVVRRTGADVGLTLVAILFAVVWMQGLGVLLGPDYRDLIGYFDSQRPLFRHQGDLTMTY